MGNRAVICFETTKYVIDKKTGVYKPKGKTVEAFALYLHWNGGPESIYAFLDVCNKRFADRGNDHGYFAARLTETIGRFFGGNLSLGLLSVSSTAIAAINCKRPSVVDEELSQGDNGVYVLGHRDNDGFTVVGRYVDGKALTPSEIAVEETKARAEKGFAERVAAIDAPNAFPKEEVEA
jgi:hypothetical protein